MFDRRGRDGAAARTAAHRGVCDHALHEPHRPHRRRPPELPSIGPRHARVRGVRRRRRGGGRRERDRRRRGPRPRCPRPRRPATGHDRIRRMRRAPALHDAARHHPGLEPRRGRLRRARRAIGRMWLRPQGRALRRSGQRAPAVSRFVIGLGAALLVLEVSVAIAIMATSDHNTAPWWSNGLAIAAGVAFVVSGLIAIVRRPENKTGFYLAAVGYAWFLGALADANNAWIATVGNIFGSLAFAAFAALLLTYPTGHYGSRLERSFPWIVGGTFVVLTLA